MLRWRFPPASPWRLFGHLMDVGDYGVLSRDTKGWASAAWRPMLPARHLGRLVICGLPFLPIVAILLLAGEGAGLGGIPLRAVCRKLDSTFSVF